MPAVDDTEPGPAHAARGCARLCRGGPQPAHPRGAGRQVGEASRISCWDPIHPMSVYLCTGTPSTLSPSVCALGPCPLVPICLHWDPVRPESIRLCTGTSSTLCPSVYALGPCSPVCAGGSESSGSHILFEEACQWPRVLSTDTAQGARRDRSSRGSTEGCASFCFPGQVTVLRTRPVAAECSRCLQSRAGPRSTLSARRESPSSPQCQGAFLLEAPLRRGGHAVSGDCG